jgi:membrane protein
MKKNAKPKKKIDFSLETIDVWVSKRPSLVRIIYDSVRVFLLEHCTMRATALSYILLMASIPFLILLTSISLSLGVGDLFINHLPRLLPEMLEKITPYINKTLSMFIPDSDIELNTLTNVILENVMPFLLQAQDIPLGSLGIIGGFALLFTFLSAIDAVETNMNIVWGVNETRNYGQKAVIFIPFLLLFASGIGIFSVFLRVMRDILETILTQHLPFGTFGGLLVNLGFLLVLPVMILFALWLLYCYMPYLPQKSFWQAAREKTKERWLPAAISAVFTFVALILFGGAMVLLQANMLAKWSLFYGSLAFLPMLMFLLFGFWCIVLFGNVLCWRITNKKQSPSFFLERIASLAKH